MPEIDDEIIARTIRWCAEAGRHATPGQVRAALARLSWDELLSARALLADAPPARPLGPSALADMARGATPGVAAEREREGRYAPEAPVDEEPVETPVRVPSPARAKRGRQAAGPVIRRVRDRTAPASDAPRLLPLLDELFTSEGRALLQRLMREHGAQRGPIIRALSTGWRHPDGSPPGDDDLTRLLDAHGLTRAFESRERDEMLHALRAASGVLVRAAAQVGLSPDEFRATLDRLGAGREAESIRAVHREEVRRQATLSERVRLLLGDRQRLTDLGLLEELESDLRQRLPEHVRAVRASRASPFPLALARSLTLPPHQLAQLGVLLGIELEAPAPSAPAKRSERGSGRTIRRRRPNRR